MGRSANTEKKIRLNLEISESVRDRLERLRETTKADSFTEVVRRSLAAYDFLVAYEKKKIQVILRYPDGEEETLRVIG